MYLTKFAWWWTKQFQFSKWSRYVLISMGFSRTSYGFWTQGAASVTFRAVMFWPSYLHLSLEFSVDLGLLPLSTSSSSLYGFKWVNNSCEIKKDLCYSVKKTILNLTNQINLYTAGLEPIAPNYHPPGLPTELPCHIFLRNKKHLNFMIDLCLDFRQTNGELVYYRRKTWKRGIFISSLTLITKIWTLTTHITRRWRFSLHHGNWRIRKGPRTYIVLGIKGLITILPPLWMFPERGSSGTKYVRVKENSPWQKCWSVTN